jgi:hypothetical protein
MKTRTEVALLLAAAMTSMPLQAQDKDEDLRAGATATQSADSASASAEYEVDLSDPAARPEKRGEEASASDRSFLGQEAAIDGDKPAEMSDPFGDTTDDEQQKPSRFTLVHENSISTTGAGVVNNRSSVRLEYSKNFRDDFFVQLDSKLTAFWSNDHRAVAGEDTVAFESSTPEAYLQYSRSSSNNSYRLGVQKMIWGESEGGAITDVVSPRNFSELFLIPLEESRLGQFMFAADRFSEHGQWSAFFVPSPRFNRYPREGTAYYRPSFPENALIRSDPDLGNKHEYGLRWKKVHDRSDISLMAASLIENDYAYDVAGLDGNGRLVVDRFARRFGMIGATFNHVRGNLQFEGEIAYKSDRSLLGDDLRSRSKPVIDSAVGMTYSLSGSSSLGLEWVNSHVVDWDRVLAPTPRNQSSLVVNTSFAFLSDRLTVNWLTIVTRPSSSVQSSVRASYQWRESTALQFDLHVVGDTDRDAALRTYRDTDQIALRVRHQF